MIYNTIPKTTRQLSPCWCRRRDAVHWADEHKTWFTFIYDELRHYIITFLNWQTPCSHPVTVFVQGEQLCLGEVQPENLCEASSSILSSSSSSSAALSLSVCLSDCRRCDPRLHRRHDSGGEPQWSWDSLSVFVRTVHRPTDWGQALPDMFGRDAAGWQPVRRPVSVRGERTWMWAAQSRESEWFKRLEMRGFFFCFFVFLLSWISMCCLYPWGKLFLWLFNVLMRAL